MATYSLEEVRNVWIPENINRKVPRTTRVTGLIQRPNNSIRLNTWLCDILELDTMVQDCINSIVTSNTNTNIYNSDGALTDNRLLTSDSRFLRFIFTGGSGVTSTSFWSNGTTSTLKENTNPLVFGDSFVGQLVSEIELRVRGGNNDEIAQIMLESPYIKLETRKLGVSMSTLEVLAGSIDLQFNNSDLRIDGNPGTAGQVLTSQGPGLPPIWA